MKIYVGSKNNIKIKAVENAVLQYPKLFPEPLVVGVDVNVPLFGHPKTLQKTVQGAITRAKNAFTDCDYSFGLEGGLMEVPYTTTGFMEVGVCAMYDGKKIFLGLSPAYEWPKKVTNLILSGKADGSQAFKQLGFTHHEKLGTVKGGIIGVLTDNKLTREAFTEYSIIMALIQLDKPEMYN
jgi:inosine/xanthosine triphosphatase